MIVVAFDRLLDVAHRLAPGSVELGCPRAVPVLEAPYANAAPGLGRRLRVYPCSRPRGHDGPCRPEQGRTARETACGLRLTGTWIAWDAGDGLPLCAACEREG